MFDASTYAARRERLIEQMASGLLLFLGNDESAMNAAANHYPFRQDGSFLYFFGLNDPGLAALIDVDAGQATLYGRDPSFDDVVWDGPRPSLEEKAARVGIEETAAPEALGETLRQAQDEGRAVHFLPPYRAQHKLKLSELLDLASDMAAERVSEPFIRAVVAQREVKSDDEVVEIERALEITYAMHTLAMQWTRPGVTEQSLAGALEGIILSKRSTVSFPVIFSARGEVFHNQPRDYALQNGELVLCDAGATAPATHYAGDVTRTTPVSGHFYTRQRDLYQVVLDGQQAAIDAIRPGAKYKDVHLLAARRMTEGMKDLGFMKGDVDEAVANGAHALFFPHGLGHMLGLDVHDMEALGEDYVGYDDETRRSDQFGLNFLRLGKALQPDFTLTVEPGVYFIGPLIERWKAEGRHADFINYDRFEQHKGFGGIRIEDNVLVTEGGGRVLGNPAPKTVEEVEAMAAEGREVRKERG